MAVGLKTALCGLLSTFDAKTKSLFRLIGAPIADSEVRFLNRASNDLDLAWSHPPRLLQRVAQLDEDWRRLEPLSTWIECVSHATMRPASAYRSHDRAGLARSSQRIIAI
jgi:hypothetical protein